MFTAFLTLSGNELKVSSRYRIPERLKIIDDFQIDR